MLRHISRGFPFLTLIQLEFLDLVVAKQTYIKDCDPVANHDIQEYMSALGFTCIDNGIYQNNFILAKDVLPKNVLTDSAGDIYVIDVELSLI